MKPGFTQVGISCLLTLMINATPAQAASKQEKELARGRYLLVVGGCNDCHSPGYAESGGQMPSTQWLTGSGVGFQGPWGTTYPGNVRNLIANLNEQEWLVQARTPMRPPMPSPSLMAMTDADLTAIYRYVRTLGPAGNAAPEYVPPGQPAHTPVINFVPVQQP